MRILTIFLLSIMLVISGCAVNFYKKSPSDRAKIQELSGEVERLQQQREEEKAQFEDIKRELQKQLKGKVGLKISDRGLVITLADNVLFDSGKAKIKEDAYPMLDKIIKIIKNKAPNKNIGIEGHTDTAPIKHSGWKSNRELSTTRANNVYHYLVKKGVIKPSRLTTIGYGEYRPVASNDTKQGMAKNRRVEIVILPEYSRENIEEYSETVVTETWVK